MFRQKSMSLAEWLTFQEAYSNLFVHMFLGDPGTALFIEAGSLHEPFTLLIPSYKSESIEAISPNGWEDADPADRRWTLLVGNADASQAFGLQGPKLPGA